MDRQTNESIYTEYSVFNIVIIKYIIGYDEFAFHIREKMIWDN